LDWFERLTGFRERGYEETRGRLEVDGQQLRSRVNDRSYGIGTLELASLEDLRTRVLAGGPPGRIAVRVVTGDVRRMHADPANAGALFQVASQFNLLEMTGPDVTPEDGVTGYERDLTQGPACAIAAGAATIYRNYFVPVGAASGQTRHRQLNGLSDVGDALTRALGCRGQDLWTMRNGYAMCSQDGLAAIAAHLAGLRPEAVDALRGKLRVGLHRDVQATEAVESESVLVSQCFCSALPVRYCGGIAQNEWTAFATLVLEAAYEATLLAAAESAQRGGSNVVHLTRLGGGAFGNAEAWIDAAIRRALQAMTDRALDVRIVSNGPPSLTPLRFAESFC